MSLSWICWLFSRTTSLNFLAFHIDAYHFQKTCHEYRHKLNLFVAENSQDTEPLPTNFNGTLLRSTRKLAMTLALILNLWIHGYAELMSQERASNDEIYEIAKCLCWKTLGKCFRMSSRMVASLHWNIPFYLHRQDSMTHWANVLVNATLVFLLRLHKKRAPQPLGCFVKIDLD